MRRYGVYHYFPLFLHEMENTHDGWILGHWFFVLFEITFQHVFFLLHLLLYFLVEVLILFLEVSPYLLVVSHNYNYNCVSKKEYISSEVGM
jgi:hypothetical protein